MVLYGECLGIVKKEQTHAQFFTILVSGEGIFARFRWFLSVLSVFERFKGVLGGF